jgi:SAM-dependent methyltransferase
MNPCIDCRIFLFKKAKKYAKEIGAGFIFTGEVLDERPMSQHYPAMKLIEKEAGLEGKVLRHLHRFPEPVAALKEMARVLTPDGRLVIYDLLVSPELDRSLNELARLSDPAHRRFATHEEFLEQFAKAGLTVVQERRLHRTVNLEYWLEAAAVDPSRADLIRTRLQELPLKVQTALDLAVADDLVSFSYDDIGFRLERI